ncbi:carboxypeptidase-like regulatory domain-containing protein [Flavobacterium sp.]|uniref:carboxypeptidase-like regulatory domain-containing protein n=1 Tax=Flavobacterium sp. TaxID=239 RepID=UPI0039E4A86A
MKKFFLAAFFGIGFAASAQIKGIVKDSLSGAPIPYAMIAVENENIGSSSEEDGTFSIRTSAQSQNLVFYALGFERKIVAIAKANEVKLKPSPVQIEEIVVSDRQGTRQLEIGKSENRVSQAFDQAPRIDLKYFPNLPEYRKTKYLKQVCIVTDSKIEDATFKIHLYSVDENGYPGKELLEKDFVVSVSKGVMKTKFNLSKFNLAMPKCGLFVGFEKLMIEKNKVEKTVLDPNTNYPETQITHYPLMLYNRVSRDFVFVFTNGKWVLKSNPTPEDASSQLKVYEPAITLILTN